MPYRYDLDRHFQRVRETAQSSTTRGDGDGPAGRIYLDASPRGAGSIRADPATKRFLAWIRARKRAAERSDQG